MIVSRVLPPLIKLNQVINLTAVGKSQLLNPRYCNKHCLEALKAFDFRGMSTDLVEELNDPKRHFDYDQLIAKKSQQNVVVIDVREHSEINETGKIPGSIHIPLAELKKSLTEMSEEEFEKLYRANKPQKDVEIIFSCKAGGRSLKALKLGLELGYNKVGNYKGGWLDWAEKTGISK